MMKILTAVLLLSSLTVLTGCGSEGGSSLTTGGGTSALPQPDVDCGGNPCIE